MDARTLEFNVWMDGVPFINVQGSPEFDVWSNGVPIVDQDESVGTEFTYPRRRVSEH